MLHRIAPRHTLTICCLLSSLFVIPTMAQEGSRRGNDRSTESRRRDERDVRERTDRPSEGRGRQARSRSEQPGNSREYHLRSAIRHLRAAGLGDEAERLERSVRQHRGQDAPRTRDRGPSDRTQNQNRQAEFLEVVRSSHGKQMCICTYLPKEFHSNNCTTISFPKRLRFPTLTKTTI